MPADLYEADILAWSEEQADLLRRLRKGERVDAAVDWENVIDEVETVGRSELAAYESLLEQAIAHLLKIHLEPTNPAFRPWRGETLAFLHQARRRFSPAMRQRIDLPALYRERVGIAVEEVGPVAGRVPQTAPSAWMNCLPGSRSWMRCWPSSASETRRVCVRPLL